MIDYITLFFETAIKRAFFEAMTGQQCPRRWGDA